MNFELRYTGKVVIVTGAAIGNGRAIAHRFAQEGAHVIIADIADASETIDYIQAHQCKGSVSASRTDITVHTQTEDLVENTIKQFGRIDILINNAGIYDEEPFELISYDRWKQVVDVNLNGLFLMTSAVLPIMKKHSYGRIINMSSNTIWLGTPYLVHYITTKMGVVGFTRALASEAGQYGITVNSLTVGITASQRPNIPESVRGNLLSHILPKYGSLHGETPEDIAEIVAFLASEKASMINGQTINVDGGAARH
jgi:3-oxoacyl-[acyl-carrier protein] reductase